MKKLLLFCLLISLFHVSFSQEYCPTYEYLTNTFYISYKGSGGTCFLVVSKHKHYFITARHLFSGNEKKISFGIRHMNEWQQYAGTVYFHNNPKVDIAVIVTNFRNDIDTAFTLENPNITIGQGGFFIGFPLGHGSEDLTGQMNNGYPIPLVKKTILSGISMEQGVKVNLFDGFNNHGFSGGPVFFVNYSHPANKFYLAGVIKGYYYDYDSVKIDKAKYQFQSNSGIIVATDPIYIQEIINTIP
jgi:hypothetical protein